MCVSLPSFYTVSLSTDSGPGSPDSNYLRVAQSLAGRRLSDNVIGNNSGNRGRPAPSSSVHLSPATCLSVGSLPTRRHSSIGSTDRRPSTANLLPPSVIVYIYMFGIMIGCIPPLCASGPVRCFFGYRITRSWTVYVTGCVCNFASDVDDETNTSRGTQ